MIALIKFTWNTAKFTMLWLLLMTAVLVYFTAIGEGHWIGWLLVAGVHVVFWVMQYNFKKKLARLAEQHIIDIIDFVDANYNHDVKRMNAKVHYSEVQAFLAARYK